MRFQGTTMHLLFLDVLLIVGFVSSAESLTRGAMSLSSRASGDFDLDACRTRRLLAHVTLWSLPGTSGLSALACADRNTQWAYRSRTDHLGSAEHGNAGAC